MVRLQQQREQQARLWEVFRVFHQEPMLTWVYTLPTLPCSVLHELCCLYLVDNGLVCDGLSCVRLQIEFLLLWMWCEQRFLEQFFYFFQLHLHIQTPKQNSFNLLLLNCPVLNYFDYNSWTIVSFLWLRVETSKKCCPHSLLCLLKGILD